MDDATCRTRGRGTVPNPGGSASQEGTDARCMILTGMTLIGAIAMQCAIFAIVLLGGRGALVTIGSAVSWITVEMWRVGGDTTIPLAACVLTALSCLVLVVLRRNRWIELPRPVDAWLHRALGVTGSAAVVMGVTRAL